MKLGLSVPIAMTSSGYDRHHAWGHETYKTYRHTVNAFNEEEHIVSFGLYVFMFYRPTRAVLGELLFKSNSSIKYNYFATKVI